MHRFLEILREGPVLFDGAIGTEFYRRGIYLTANFEELNLSRAHLVRSVHAPDQLLSAATELAREIADNTAPVSVALTRQMLWRMLGADHPMEAHIVDSRAIAFMGESADVKEGVQSFLEKRQPRFKLRPSQDRPDFYPWWKDRPFR